MKKIEAIVREERLEAIRIALEKQGYFGMTITEASGRGRQKGLTLQWRAGEYCIDFLPKIKIEVVILDEDVPRVLNAIITNAKTGEERGDGKVFIIPVENAVRVRTGEMGENAI